MDRTLNQIRDAGLINTKALPNGAAAVNGDGFDLGALSDRGARLENVELLITAPALDTADLPDTKTMTYKVQHDTASDFGTAATLADAVLVQTGAGGAGDDAATARFRFPADCNRYVRVVATNSGTGDASDKSMTTELLF